MIQNTEMRIGNLIMSGLGAYEPVTEVMSNGVFTIGGFHLYGDVTPIPLTPQILEKAGFPFEGGYWMGPITNEWRMKLWHNDDHDFLWSISNWNAIPIHSVHQLQNLYFALTSQELTITL